MGYKKKAAPAEESATGSSRRRNQAPLEGLVGAAEAQAERDGLRVPDRPGEEVPGLPDDITSLGDKELMRVMREQIAWAEYTGYRLARGEIEEREIMMHINQRQAVLLVSSWGGSRDDRVALAKANVESDVQLTRLRESHLRAQAYRKIVQNLYEAVDQRVRLVSRELSRRISMEPAQKRSHRHGGA